jgi:hypothetical protein
MARYKTGADDPLQDSRKERMTRFKLTADIPLQVFFNPFNNTFFSSISSSPVG